MTREEILEEIQRKGGVADEATAIRVARAVVCSLRERLPAEEADHLEDALRADLPDLLECSLHTHAAPEKRRDRLTEPEVAERVRAEAGLADAAQARKLIRVILTALTSRLGEEAEEGKVPANLARSVGALARRPPSGRGGGPGTAGGEEEPEDE